MSWIEEGLAVPGKVWKVLHFYRDVFSVLGFFGPERVFPPAKKDHSYGIVIAARNEERVIGSLLESIALQDYDPALLHVFVVADNCTDGTADICRAHGATVYERHEPEKARKGWALEFLFDHIRRDFGIESLDAYLFFDADNLLSRSFVTEINRAFDACGTVAVGYRNTKNFDTNFISAAYGLHFYESTMTMHRPRSLLRQSTHVAGCGYAVSSHILADGWRWTCLTEDAQFYMDQISRGRHIEFCEAAEFFDEQPHSVGVMVRQRLRWAKGRLVCFLLLFPRLIAGAFRHPRESFSCFDMFMYVFPISLCRALGAILKLALSVAAGVAAAGVAGYALNTLPGAILGFLGSFGLTWLRRALWGAVIALRERRHIRCSRPKLPLYILLWPFFNTTGPLIALASVFMRVRWKPIRHDRDVTIGELEAADRQIR